MYIVIYPLITDVSINIYKRRVFIYEHLYSAAHDLYVHYVVISNELPVYVENVRNGKTNHTNSNAASIT